MGKEVVLGVRPRAISTRSDLEFNKDTACNVVVNIVEQLGDDKLIYAKLDDKEIILSTNPDANITNGEEIEVSFDLSHMCLFDKESTETILNF